jgi:Flp pilus assembly protein TadG
MNLFTLAAGQGAEVVRTFLGRPAERLRLAVRDRDRGASAIELAIITAVLVLLAVFVVTIIYNYAKGQATTITQHTIPNGN